MLIEVMVLLQMFSEQVSPQIFTHYILWIPIFGYRFTDFNFRISIFDIFSKTLYFLFFYIQRVYIQSIFTKLFSCILKLEEKPIQKCVQQRSKFDIIFILVEVYVNCKKNVHTY